MKHNELVEYLISNESITNARKKVRSNIGAAVIDGIDNEGFPEWSQFEELSKANRKLLALSLVL